MFPLIGRTTCDLLKQREGKACYDWQISLGLPWQEQASMLPLEITTQSTRTEQAMRHGDPHTAFFEPWKMPTNDCYYASRVTRSRQSLNLRAELLEDIEFWSW